MKARGIVCSMGCRGNRHDDAVADGNVSPVEFERQAELSGS